ncbi:MAG: molybdenum cofactor guanylyltransferase [Gammaproteobacteria bacterium]|nr:molybdenum cofactor guanylyltransferase [Gammaproteobacteria bacterium]
MQYTIEDITVIILAGGQGKRLGNQNKGLLKLNGETFVSHLLKKMSKQSASQIISANNDISLYKQFNKTIVEDQVDNYQGPLSGIISCKPHANTALVLTIPCDSPLVPANLSQRLLDTYNQHSSTKLCVVHDGSMLQNLFMLFDKSLLNDMEDYFQKDQRQVRAWINRHDYEAVNFSDQALHFTNVNDEASFQRLLSLEQSQ